MKIDQISRVSDEHRAIFERDGAVCVRGLISPDWIGWLRDHVQHVLDHANGNPGARNIAAEAGKTGRFHNESSLWRNWPGFADFIRQSPIAPAAADLTGSRGIRLYNDHLLVKEPGTDAPTPWHQDGAYFRMQGSQMLSVWIGLDPVGEATGAMSFVRGSHAWNKMFRPVAFASGADRESEAFDGSMPDIDSDREAYDLVCYEMEPGDVTFHHALTIHGSGGNKSSSQRRRGYSVRFAGDDVRYALRSWTSYVIGEGLKDGDPLNGHCDFPLLWPKE